MDLIRGACGRMGKPATTVPLHVVHRIDRAEPPACSCSRSRRRAEQGLAPSCARTRMERTYLCVRPRTVTSRRIESYLVADRGDGLRRLDDGASTRASARHPRRGPARLRARDPVRVRLETRQDHQIRIHLAEAGTRSSASSCTSALRGHRGKLLDLATADAARRHAPGFEHRSPARTSRCRPSSPPTSWRCNEPPRAAARASHELPGRFVIRFATAADCAVILGFHPRPRDYSGCRTRSCRRGRAARDAVRPAAGRRGPDRGGGGRAWSLRAVLPELLAFLARRASTSRPVRAAGRARQGRRQRPAGGARADRDPSATTAGSSGRCSIERAGDPAVSRRSARPRWINGPAPHASAGRLPRAGPIRSARPERSRGGHRVDS